MMQAMNTQSTRKESDLRALHFYVLPYEWMRRAWPVLSGKIESTDDKTQFGTNWREKYIGKIINENLLVAHVPNQLTPTSSVGGDNNGINNIAVENNAISNSSSDSEPDISLQQRRHKQDLLSEIQKKPKTKLLSHNSTSGPGTNLLVSKNFHPVVLRNDLKFNKDFFFVGPNVWLLLKMKFGYDHEIKCGCTFNIEKHCLVIKTPQQGKKETSGAVTTITTGLYLVPPTGRFPYEEFITTTTTTNSLSLVPQKSGTATIYGNNVSDDEGQDELQSDMEGRVSVLLCLLK